MNNLEDREVVILAAHCEACGEEVDGHFAGEGPAEPVPEQTIVAQGFTIEPFPVRVPQSYVREEFRCYCGGRIVFALMGASDDR